MDQLYVPPKPIGIRKAAVEEFAPQVAEKLNFKPADDMFSLVDRLGGKVLTGSTGLEDKESGSMIARSISDFTIYLSPLTSLERDRFTIAHELGHLLLHLPTLKAENPSVVMRATRYIDNGDAAQQRAEWEANWFAASLLMPAREFKRLYPYGVVHLQNAFNVSLAAVRSRIKSLGLAEI
ncbi:uncharacterized protein DUF955 [Rhizobium sp. PP-F2F-G36]|nr:uncharacterized protein DUF955 [Rhizobium sp. PP-F2F-G36]